MSDHFRPRRRRPGDLVVPSTVDPTGRTGPTRSQASGPGWRRTTRGRAVPTSAPRSAEQHLLEEAQRLPDGGAVGGWAALLLHGAAYFPVVPDDPVPLVVGRPDNLAARPGTRVVRLAAPPRVVLRHGIPCTDPVSALLDVVHREHLLRRRVVAIDMALAAGVVALDELVTVGDAQGATRLREALPLVDGRSASPPESWLRLVWVLDAGLPVPRCNWPLFDLDGAPLGRPDLVSDEIGVCAEYDGGAHASSHRRRADSVRRDDHRRVGLEVVTVVAGGWGREAAVARQLLDARARSAAWVRPRGWRYGVE